LPAGGAATTPAFPFPVAAAARSSRLGEAVVSHANGIAASHSPERRGDVHTAQQTPLHADGRALRAAAHLDVPEPVLENFYVKTHNSIEQGNTQAPYGWVFPVQRDMTRVVTLVNVFRAQGIEVGRLTSDLKIGTDTYPAGSYVVKLNQPYGRLAKNLLERQDYPDPALTSYDDTGWSMGYAMNVDVKAVQDKAILTAVTTPVKTAELMGKVTGSGTAGSRSRTSARRHDRLPLSSQEHADEGRRAVVHVDGVAFPPGSFILTGSDLSAARTAVESLGLTAVALSSVPTVATHDADVPRVAIYSQWSGTQELGWYRHAFDQFGIPFDLIFKERVMKGNLKADYDVIIMATQNVSRTAVLAPPAARPQPYQRSDKYKFLGMYGETADMSGGFGQTGVRRTIEKVLARRSARIHARRSRSSRSAVDTDRTASFRRDLPRSCDGGSDPDLYGPWDQTSIRDSSFRRHRRSGQMCSLHDRSERASV